MKHALMSDGLRIEVDEPGRRLVLARPGPPFPTRVVAGFGLAIAACLGLAWFWPAAIALALILFGLLLGVFSARLRTITRIVFEGATGRVAITRLDIVGESAPVTYPTARHAGMRVTALRPPPTIPSAGFRIRLRMFYGSGRMTRSYTFAVAGVSALPEAEDLARRMASAVAFGHELRARSDPRELTLDFAAAPGPGYTVVPEIRAAADYARARPAPPAPATAQERLPPFDPATFQSDPRLEVWQPGRLVRLRRPFGFAAIGCLPGVLLVLAGPAAFVVTGLFEGNTTSDRVFIACFAGLFGLVLGGISAAAVYSGLPRTIVFDWGERRLRIQGLFGRSEHDFSEIRAIGMTSQRLSQRSRVDLGAATYYCQVTALVGEPGAPPRPVILVSTSPPSATWQAPYHACLPLVSELSHSLGVARDLGNYADAGNL